MLESLIAMSMTNEQISAIGKLEDVLHEDIAKRGTASVFEATRGQLLLASTSIASADHPYIGLITGFIIEKEGSPSAAETDGPLGTALFARFLKQAGIPFRVITDTPCAPVCHAALEAVGISDDSLEVVSDFDRLQSYKRYLLDHPFTHLIAAERPGLNGDGVACNMRGVQIKNSVAFDTMFERGLPWLRIGVLDGGNEIGSGMLKYETIIKDIPHGKQIACKTGADFLITAGVSNWGLNALVAGLGVCRSEWRSTALEVLNPVHEIKALARMVSIGRAVDGITGRSELSVDSVPMEYHVSKTEQMNLFLRQYELASVNRLEFIAPDKPAKAGGRKISYFQDRMWGARGNSSQLAFAS